MQSPAFQLAGLYLVFEYVRPQSRFPALDFLPWTQIVILSGIAALIPELGRKGGARTSILFWLIVYLAIAAISLLFAEFPSVGLEKWAFLLPWIVIFFLIANVTTSIDRFLLLLIIYVLCNLRFSQFGLRSFVLGGFTLPGYGFHGPVGWFQNSGELGVQMAMFVPLSVMVSVALWNRWGTIGKGVLVLVPVSAVVTTVGTMSRGAILAAAVAICWIALALGVRIRNFVVIGMLAGIGALLIPDRLMERFESAGEDTTSTRRLTMWKDGIEIIREHPIIGVGYFNWMPYYRLHFPAVDDVGYLGSHQLPHNILIQAAAELGFIGLAVFLVLLFLSFHTNRSTRMLLPLQPEFRPLRLISHGLDASMLAFFVAGQFVTVLYYPYFWITLALVAALHEGCRREFVLPRRRGAQRVNRQGEKARADHQGVLSPKYGPAIARPASRQMVGTRKRHGAQSDRG